MRQINIFEEIDYIDENGNIKRCEICQKGIDEGDICSDECAKIWIKKYIDEGLD